jgi:hypothetical protein
MLTFTRRARDRQRTVATGRLARMAGAEFGARGAISADASESRVVFSRAHLFLQRRTRSRWPQGAGVSTSPSKCFNFV